MKHKTAVFFTRDEGFTRLFKLSVRYAKRNSVCVRVYAKFQNIRFMKVEYNIQHRHSL